jgi:hypothetical protein
MGKAKVCQLKKAKLTVNSEVPNPQPNWELAIADAEERIGQLRRSIEIFKHNSKAGLPFPVEAATHN